MQPEVERQRFISRFDQYRDKGDIKIISNDQPELIVEQIVERLEGIR